MATAKRRALENLLLGLIAQGAQAPELSDSAFEELALRMFHHQYRRNAAYRVFCERKGVRPARVRCLDEIPAVPVSAFKRERFACFPAADTAHVFETSGTTGGPRGRLYLDSLDLYKASLLASFKEFVIPDVPHIRMASLTASFEMAVSSSLIYMLDQVIQAHGAPGSRFFGTPTRLDFEALMSWLSMCEAEREPVLICGTAFGFFDLFEQLGRRGLSFRMPEGSRVMETGGLKGRKQDIEAETYYGFFEKFLAVAPPDVISEYGMTEMGSQFYDAHLSHCVSQQGAGGAFSGLRVKAGPAWVRTRVIRAGSQEEAGPGEPGILVHYDLANLSTVLAVQTQDIGRACDGGFEFLGRVLGSEPRGCSLADEERILK